jgi:hypothetical protein
MWICLSDGFLSIVKSSEYSNVLVVRARRVEILELTFPGSKIFVTDDSDYKYRLFADRAEVAVVMMEKLFSLDYPNFKASVHDKELYRLYHSFWREHCAYQQ